MIMDTIKIKEDTSVPTPKFLISIFLDFSEDFHLSKRKREMSLSFNCKCWYAKFQ